MPNLPRLLKRVPATSSAFFFHQNISKNTYFQITKKNGIKILLHVHFNGVTKTAISAVLVCLEGHINFN